jgi:hypothetical protein
MKLKIEIDLGERGELLPVYDELLKHTARVACDCKNDVAGQILIPGYSIGLIWDGKQVGAITFD